MKVTLIDYDPEAADKLIFTKHTRLNMTPNLLADIREWPEEKKAEELKYISNTIRSSHEFTNYTFLIEGVSRAFTHQFVRSRTGSYAQQSMRVTEQAEFEFVWPTKIADDLQAGNLVAGILDEIKAAYVDLIEMGIPAEDARSILPTNISTNIVARFNLRAFADLASSRAGGRTQSEYRDVANAMVDEVLEVHPWAEQFIFRDNNRDYFGEIEAFAEQEYGGDLIKKGQLLKIIDAMRGVK